MKLTSLWIAAGTLAAAAGAARAQVATAEDDGLFDVVLLAATIPKDYPQGLTCGLTYANHVCTFDVWKALSDAAELACKLPALLDYINNKSAPNAMTPGPNSPPGMNGAPKVPANQQGFDCSAQIDVPLSCGPIVLFSTPCMGVQTISYDSQEALHIRSAPGFMPVFDGDFGNDALLGFYHQAYVGGETRAWLADRFDLPQGTVCGFHHTRNSPRQRCMGLDPAAGQCPKGWVPRSAFDMSSDTGHWAWCEYQDPHGLSADWKFRPQLQGIACGISDNAWGGGSPGFCMKQDTRSHSGVASCPPPIDPRDLGTGFFASYFFDDGQRDGLGLGWCTASYCKPKVTRCPMYSCGYVADGCGNMLYCGACPGPCPVGMRAIDCGDGARCRPTNSPCP